MKPENHVTSVVIHSSFKNFRLTSGVILTVAGSIVFSLLSPFILGKIIDRIAGGTGVSLLLMLCYFAAIVFSGIFDFSRESLLIILGQKITHALRSSLSRKLTFLSADCLYKQEPGALTSRFISDVNTVEKLFTAGIISMITDVCKLISILIVVSSKAKGLTILLLLLLPVIFFFTRAVQKRMLKAQIENRATISRMTGHIPETLQCIRTIHTLQKESYMEKRYNNCIRDSYHAIEKNNFYDSVYSPVIMVLNAVIVAAVMLLSASGNPVILTLFGMSVGTAVAVINYIGQIFSPLENIGMEIQTIQSAVAGVKRINEFLNLPERAKPEETVPVDSFPHCIEFQNVSFGYLKQVPVLKQLNFYVDSGGQLTILGKTGAGKSTIFKLLLGLYQPEQGRVLINGADACSIPDREKRKIIGYVSQSFHTVPGTVRDQITLFDPSLTDEMVIKAAKLTGIHDIIRHMEKGYETPCIPSLFSQGQWQLLSIARAIVAEPIILLLDEITADLDAETEKNVMDALNRVSENRTVISISHRIYSYGNKSGNILSLDS